MRRVTSMYLKVAAGGFTARKRRRGFNTAQHMSPTVLRLKVMLYNSLRIGYRQDSEAGAPWSHTRPPRGVGASQLVYLVSGVES